MSEQKIVKKLAIRNYTIFFTLKENEFIKLEDCHENLKEIQIESKLDLESYKAIHVKFNELSFNFFSSGKGTLYFSKENLSIQEANEILNRFYYAFIESFIIKAKS